MIEKAFGVLRTVQERIASTLKTAAVFAEAFGVPAPITSWLQRCSNGQSNHCGDRKTSYETTSYDSVSSWDPSASRKDSTTSAYSSASSSDSHSATPSASPIVHAENDSAPKASSPASAARVSEANELAPKEAEETASDHEESTKPSSKGNHKKRPLEGNRTATKHVRTIAADDEIEGSTYLARIVWCLGVAELEGLGSLRPADIARMVMARSPVSLEPPNIARYIRRSKPTCIAIDHADGGSNFYKLNEEGRQFFKRQFSAASR